LVVDEKFLDVESHSLMLAGKTLHPLTFYAIQLWRYFHNRKTF